MTHTNQSHVLRPTPKVVLEQSKKYAMGALEHFNKRKKVRAKSIHLFKKRTYYISWINL
jgi:hypothetical protein